MNTGPQIQSFIFLSPEGKVIQLNRAVFEAIAEFVDNKKTGRVELQFADGGIAGVEGHYSKKFKNGNGH